MKMLAASLMLLLVPLTHCEEDFHIVLDPQEKFRVSWSYESFNKSGDITFEIKCKTTGWVGLGMSPNGAMTGSDIVVMWVDSSGEGHIKDMHGIANQLPELDLSQDYTLISFSEKDGESTFKYKRKIDTCDYTDNPVSTDTTRLIYAYGEADPTGNELSAKDKHELANRGSKSIYLLEVPEATGAVPDDAMTHDFLSDQYEIPAKSTSYFCSFHFPPEMDRKHHIVAYEPVIQEGSEAFVHHIILYGCYDVTKAHLKDSDKTQGECYTNEMPEFADSCSSVTFGWAVGATKFHLPPDAGFPLGTDDQQSPEFFMMEVHYDNPQKISGVVDSSGLRMTYTPTLRPNDVGVLQSGGVYGIVVPPKQEKFRITGYCHSSCTKEWVPEGGVTFFAYTLHSHLLGVDIKVEHYRDEQPLHILAEDKHYDFNYQELRQFQQNPKILPGDTLKVTCTYSSLSRERVTVGGLATEEEMCLAFFFYYPKGDVGVCQSFPGFLFNHFDGLYTGLGIQPEVVNYDSYSLVSVYEALDNISDWTDEKVVTVQKACEKTYPVTYCLDNSGHMYNYDVFNPEDYPPIEVEEEDGEYCAGIISVGSRFKVNFLLFLSSLLAARSLYAL